eukprot:GSChrysophyteH1.ASY1.ANO1.1096.1 assembled CDS
MSMLYYVLLLGFIVVTTSSEPDSRYDAQCEMTSSGASQGFGFPCSVALFSHFNFRGTGFLDYNSSVTLCGNIVKDSKDRHDDKVLAVHRGTCSFDEKARNAVKLGYKALFVVDSSDNESLFPMGSQQSEFKSSIPVLMMHRSSLSLICTTNDDDKNDQESEVIQACTRLMEISFSYANATEEGPSSIRDNLELIQSLPEVLTKVALILLPAFIFFTFLDQLRDKAPVVVPAAISPVSEPKSHSKLTVNTSTGIAAGPCSDSGNNPGAFYNIGVMVAFAIIIILAIVLRLGTYRLVVTDGISEYHHNETDERIFEYLIQSVSKDWRDYSLGGKEIISRLRLSRENYDDAIFIHPPNFVYFSMYLQTTFGLSLPSISLLFHVATMILIPFIVYFGDETTTAADFVSPPTSSQNTNYSTGAVTLWSVLIFSLDPLAFFCSQKFWIDNALLFCITLAVAIHVFTWRRTAVRMPRSRFMQVCRSFLSGIIYGALVLNCKVTGLALLPFMIAWIVVSQSESSRIRNIFSLSIVPYILGTCISHAPWLYIYHLHTDRWVPNAWPSVSMLQTSVFVRNALNKSVWFYLQMLLEFSPLHVLGILFGILVCITYTSKQIWQTCHSTSRRARINGDNFVTFGSSGRITALLIWPLSFLVGCTLVGVAGGGYQSRFILPIIPATSILAARIIHRASSLRAGYNALSAATHVLVSLALAYCAMHCLYYGMMFPNLYADLDKSVVSILYSTLGSFYHPISTPESMNDMLKFLGHYGVHLRQGQEA